MADTTEVPLTLCLAISRAQCNIGTPACGTCSSHMARQEREILYYVSLGLSCASRTQCAAASDVSLNTPSATLELCDQLIDGLNEQGRMQGWDACSPGQPAAGGSPSGALCRQGQPGAGSDCCRQGQVCHVCTCMWTAAAAAQDQLVPACGITLQQMTMHSAATLVMPAGSKPALTWHHVMA